MSKQSLRIVLILITILSLISTFSLATDTANTPVTTSEDTATTDVKPEGEATTDGATGENLTTGETAPTEASTNHDLYLIQDEVKITDTETVNGNAFIIADTVTINGQIGGDLFVMATTLNIDGGQIYGNVFAIAENITLNGLIYDLYGKCDTLTMSYDGVAYRDLKVSCDNATINGVVGKDVNIDTKSLSLESDCLIYGDLNYSAPNEIQIAEGLVTGKVNYEKASVKVDTDNNISVLGLAISLLTTIFCTLIIGFLVSKLTPRFYAKVTGMKPTKLLLALLVGLITLIVVPLIAILLMITFVGIPVAFMLLAIYAFVIAISFALTTIVVASKLASKAKALAKFKNLFAIIIVAIVLWALKLIPIAGGIISFLITLCGLGIFVLGLKKEKTKQIEAPVESAE